MITFLAKLRLFFGTILAFLKPSIEAYMTAVGKVLADVALKTVKRIAQDPSLLTQAGAAKREIAFNQIVDELKSRGLEASTSFINRAIEDALANYKASQGNK